MNNIASPSNAPAQVGSLDANQGVRIKVLVCDDDDRYLEVLRLLLESESFEVITTADPNAVLLLATQHGPDVIVSDVAMPGVDGFDLAYGLRADVRTASIPLIFLSARPKDLNRLQAQAVGAVQFLQKPLAIANLVRCIHQTLAHNRERLS